MMLAITVMEEAYTMEPTFIETLTIEERIQLYLDEKAILRQQDSLQGKMFHENFGFATTYHVKVPEEMSAIGNVSFESDGLTGCSTNVLGRDALDP